MKSLMSLLMEHSYLKDQMAGIPNPMADPALAVQSKCPITRVKRLFKRNPKPQPLPAEVSRMKHCEFSSQVDPKRAMDQRSPSCYERHHTRFLQTAAHVFHPVVVDGLPHPWAEAPAISVLPSFSGSPAAPTRVTTDSQGSTFVVDTVGGRVVVFDVFGRVAAERTGLRSPLGIAIDHTGNIYLGEAGAVVSPSLIQNGTLWQSSAKATVNSVCQTTSPWTKGRHQRRFTSATARHTVKAYQNGTLVRNLGGRTATPPGSISRLASGLTLRGTCSAPTKIICGS